MCPSSRKTGFGKRGGETERERWRDWLLLPFTPLHRPRALPACSYSSPAAISGSTPVRGTLLPPRLAYQRGGVDQLESESGSVAWSGEGGGCCQGPSVCTRSHTGRQAGRWGPAGKRREPDLPYWNSHKLARSESNPCRPHSAGSRCRGSRCQSGKQFQTCTRVCV